MIVNYAPHTTRVKLPYKCTCGHRFYRTNSDYWTRSPFNRHSDAYCNASTLVAVYTERKKCPKCGTMVDPVLRCFDRDNVARWKRIMREESAKVKT
jgi:hypothetical protein